MSKVPLEIGNLVRPVMGPFKERLNIEKLKHNELGVVLKLNSTPLFNGVNSVQFTTVTVMLPSREIAEIAEYYVEKLKSEHDEDV